MLELNRIYNMDCLEGMKLIPDNSIDFVVCDVPFGETKNSWDKIIPMKPMWKELSRIVKYNSAICLFAKGKFLGHLMCSNIKKYRYKIVCKKTNPTGFLNANKMPLKAHEDALVFYNSLPRYNPQKTTGHPRKVSTAQHKRNCVKTSNYGEHRLTSYDSTERFPVDVLEFSWPTVTLHPTQKPVELIEYLIKTYTNEGDTVLDFCMGSGTTAVACVNTNRNFIGFELLKEYCDIAATRIELECSQLRLG